MSRAARFQPEEPHLERLRRLIEDAYREHPTGTGGSFGEILCHEIHENGMTFIWLAQKWGISLPTLGELIWDHCKKLERAGCPARLQPGRLALSVADQSIASLAKGEAASAVLAVSGLDVVPLGTVGADVVDILR
jgi:hypothetical protein